MTPEAQLELSGLEIDSPLFLYILDLNPIGTNEVYYYSPYTLNGAQVSYGGQVYTYGHVNISGVGYDADGGNAQPQLVLPNVGGLVASLCVQHKDLVGARVTRIKTLKTFLDGQPMENGNANIHRQKFIIIRKARLNKRFGLFELRSLASIQNMQIPRQVCLKNVCSHTYGRNGAGAQTGTCPYSDAVYFKRDGTSTALAAEDECSQDYTGCDKRYPNGNGNPPKPIRAFPAMRAIQ